MARYFVNRHVSRNDAAGDGIGRYWRGRIDDSGVPHGGEVYSGWCRTGDTYASVKGTGTSGSMRFQVNLQLLAQLLGDTIPAGIPVVEPIEYEARHCDEPCVGPDAPKFVVQPWEWSSLILGPEVPIGNRLAAFLDDPLGLGRPLGLSLPFLDPAATVSNTWFRDDPEDREGAFHGGFDFSALPTRSGGLRPLMDVCAAFRGTVWMLLEGSGKKGGVVLRHEPAPGAVFATLYQHVLPSSVKLAVGESVERGQRIGRIRRWLDGEQDRTHLHFNVLVRGPRPPVAPWFWFSIDPFGVYEDRLPSDHPNANYVPRDRGGMREAIRGADRAIHWAGNPPIRAFVGELKSERRKIESLQMRGRTTGGAETAQMLIWLAGESERYHLRLGGDLDRGIESETCALLRDAYHHNKSVTLAYRFRDNRKYVSAVWAVA